MAYNCKTKNSYWSVLEIDLSIHAQHLLWVNFISSMLTIDKSAFEKLPLPRGTAELKTCDIYSGLTS